jgi:hypothetical protein
MMKISHRSRHLVLLAFLLSCSVSCTKNSTPSTPWEQVTAYNATFSEANQAIEQGTQALVGLGTLTAAQGQPVIALTLRVAQIHQQITAILGTGSALTAANVMQLQSLLAQIQSSANALVQNGALGVKNPRTQNSVNVDIVGLMTIANQVINLLPQLQASPAPSMMPVAPVKSNG